MDGAFVMALLSVCLLVTTAGAEAAHAAEILRVQDFVMRTGDDPAWSTTGYDDADWQAVRFHDVPQTDSVVWLRTIVDLQPSHLAEGQPLGIYIAALASHEIWWDGELLARGGIVGSTPESEQPGPIQAHYLIPERLAAVGPHALAVRTSAFHRHFRPQTGYWYVFLGPYDRIARADTSYIRMALIALSGIVMMAIFSVMMFAQNTRDNSFLFLGLLCVTGALLLLAESYRGWFGYTYNWHLLRLSIVTGLSWLLDVLLLVFLARRFPMKGSKWFVLVGALGATVPILVNQSWDPKALWGFAWAFGLSAVWCGLAAWRRRHGSIPALVGVSACFGVLFYSPYEFADRNLFWALNALFICLLASHVLQVRRERQEREEALLKSARLEIELLKKHIQPHFLMNSLTALSEWIEEEPKTAAKLIQSLSEEFRILSDISNRSLIRMADEIRLCQSHLEIMSHRTGREYRMETEGVDPEAQIPPAVIHTLVENAITHGQHPGDRVEFRLCEERRSNGRRYVFESPYAERANGQAATDGTGLRYVRARLQESFGQDWTLASGPQGSSWRIQIDVPGVSVT